MTCYRTTSVTLKIKRRHPDAPIQTAKHLGHGWAENFSRSCQLPSPTNDAIVLHEQAWLLYQQMLGELGPVSDLRGIGLHAQRLQSSENTDSEISSTPGFMSLANSTTTTGAGTAASKQQRASRTISQLFPRNLPPESNEPPEPIPDIPRPQPVAVAAATKPIIARPNEQPGNVGVGFDELPPSSDIDDSVLRELPEHIQRELALAYRQKQLKEERLQKLQHQQSRPQLPISTSAANKKRRQPQPRDAESREPHSKRRRVTTATNPTTALNTLQPQLDLPLADSGETIDPEVFNALPIGTRAPSCVPFVSKLTCLLTSNEDRVAPRGVAHPPTAAQASEGCFLRVGRIKLGSRGAAAGQARCPATPAFSHTIRLLALWRHSTAPHEALSRQPSPGSEPRVVGAHCTLLSRLDS